MIAKKPFFKKPDEMELAISHRAIGLTWTIVNIAFVLMAVYLFATGAENLISLAVLLGVEVVYYAVKAVIKWSMVRGGADNE